LIFEVLLADGWDAVDIADQFVQAVSTHSDPKLNLGRRRAGRRRTALELNGAEPAADELRSN
jgi:hypothetical protein